MKASASLEVADIQGIVLYGYGSLRYARYVHVSFEGGNGRPAAWLGELLPEIHSASKTERRATERVNVAFTYRGLTRFSLGPGELGSFPRELQQGMNDALRAHVLGDTGESAPEAWEFGGPTHAPIDAVVMMYAKTEASLAALRDRLVARVTAQGGAVVHEDVAELRNPLREPFGFRDGISQPHVEGSPRVRNDNDVEVPTGEFVLGYPNAYGELPPSPVGQDGFDVGKNGSYLVYRKLRQDTSGFWQCMLARAEPRGDAHAAIKLASLMVGRWPSGAPLVRYPDFDPGPGAEQEVFQPFGEDPDGTKCPLGAHVRRVNPRDMLPPSPEESRKAVERHRLLRRGRPYGPPASGMPRDRAEPDGEERGLVFLALNASFRRQFEFVQQTWINNPKFGGLYDERDPVAASVVDTGGQKFSIPNDPARRRVGALPRFVTVRGGGYFFVPGLKALAWLARRGVASAAPA